VPEAFVLRGWYDSTGAEQSFQAQGNYVPGAGLTFKHQDLMSIEDVKAAKLGENPDKAEPFCIRGTVMHIKTEDVVFPACPKPKGCGRKVVQDGNGWRCDKCDVMHEKPEYR
jgi:replication factor A1